MQFHSELTEFEKKILSIITPYLVIQEPHIERPGDTEVNTNGEFWIKFEPTPCGISESLREKLKKLENDKGMDKYLGDIAMMANSAKRERKAGNGKMAEHWQDMKIVRIEIIIKALGLETALKKAREESLAAI